jgi:hypothetical protein
MKKRAITPIDGKKREITPKWVMEFTSKLQCK